MNKIGLNTARLNTALLNVAYTNGFPVLSKRSGSSADISQAIMDSLVCWYDPGKQQCTNESMAANPVLADLSGNGHDIECFNFGWSGMSGIGGYKVNFNEFSVTNNSSVKEYTYNKLVVYNTEDVNTNFWDSFNNLAPGETYHIDSYKVRISGLSDEETIRYRYYNLNDDNSTSHIEIFLRNGINTIPEINMTSITGIVNKYTTIFLYILNEVINKQITIELLPEYPNALVSDGVDDYCYTDGLPILTDYTVIAKRKLLNLDVYGCLVSKKDTNTNDNGGFFFENVSDTIQDTEHLQTYSFGANTIVPIHLDDISYQTKNSYNGITISSSNAIDVDKLVLFRRFTKSVQYRAASLYSLLLFDRTLTTAEIEWVKKNMIEGNDDDADWYGVEFYTTSPNPDCIRIGNPKLHKTLPVHSQMKGCLLADDGTVNKYLNVSDWTSETLDGSQGQVMVEMPKESYWKFETDGNIRRVKFSTKPLPGFKKTPQGYVSAYEASVQRSTNKLASVVNTDADYRGGNNNVGWDGTYRSLLGMPATQISRTNFRNYARNRKADSTEWNCMTYDMQKLLYWLFVIEYATLNTQKAFNEALTADGYHQGGLGPGVTEIDYTKWGDFNGRYPFIPCGHSDSLGNKTGVVDYTMPTEYDAASVKVCKVPRYRGIENPFGHIWQWTEGINVRISPNTEDGGDGLSKVFVCSDPSQFSDTGYEGYQYVGDEARTEAYVKEVIFGEGGEIMPLVVGGSSTTFFPDFHYTNIPKAETLRGVLFGGDASYGAGAGFVFASSGGAPSDSGAYFGSRLCFIPEQTGGGVENGLE